MKDQYIWIGVFKVAEYLITGKIPIGEGYAPEDRISDAKLVADCLTAYGVYLLNKDRSDILSGLKSAAAILGMDKFEPPFPPTGDGFIAYAESAGLLPTGGTQTSQTEIHN